MSERPGHVSVCVLNLWAAQPPPSPAGCDVPHSSLARDSLSPNPSGRSVGRSRSSSASVFGSVPCMGGDGRTVELGRETTAPVDRVKSVTGTEEEGDQLNVRPTVSPEKKRGEKKNHPVCS